MPFSLITAACTAVVGFVYLMPQGVFNTDGPYFLLEIFWPAAALFATVWRWQFRSTHRRPWNDSSFCFFVLAILLIAVAAIPLAGRFSLGRIFHRAGTDCRAAGRRMGLSCAAGRALA